MKALHQRATWYFFLILIIVIVASSAIPPAQAVTPITSSGLNTTVSAPITLPSGQTQFNITGGTRPGGGVNLFHSFGDFNVPNNNIANFLNNSGLATSNILGRVTGGNVSNIFGTIQTTGFGNANLFLMNPAGFLFGPNAMVNVGGMVTFTSADYLRLTDGARFNATPHTAPDLLLTAAPVAAFGFLGSNPGAITVQGSRLSVAEGTGISLVGGNITVQAGTLTAPSGQINLVSVGKPSHPNVGGEVANGGEFAATGFRSFGAINLSQGSTLDASAIAGTSGHSAGNVVIRGGQFVMDNSSIKADIPNSGQAVNGSGGTIEVTAEQVTLSNHSTLVTSGATDTSGSGSSGNVTFNANTFSATDSTIETSVALYTICCNGNYFGNGGSLTIEGFQGSGTSAHAISLTDMFIRTLSGTSGNGGPLLIRGDNIALYQTTVFATSTSGASAITLVSKGGLDIRNSFLETDSVLATGGTINFNARTGIDIANSTINANSIEGLNGGTITMAAPVISIGSSRLDVSSGGSGHGGTISLTGTRAVSLTNGTVLDADGILNQSTLITPPPIANGGTILIDGGTKLTSQQSTISAQSALGNGGTIQVEAHKVGLTDTKVTTSVSGGPQTVGGSISIDAHKVSLENSQMLSTATEGHGGTIGITTHKLHSTNSVFDATSQFGIDGTVTIEHP